MLLRLEVEHVVAEDGMSLYTRHWHGSRRKKPRAILHIAHGMAEHGARYEPVAQRAIEAGVAVFANDHRGHGEMAGYGTTGHFADENGWHLVVSDLFRINQHIRKKYPGVPVVLLGHSMGSFIAQQYAMDYRGTLAGLVLSGSNYDAPLVYKSARGIARLERARQGARGKSTLMNYLSFGSFNKHFAPNRTQYDWLSRDAFEVDKYVADPLCGFQCTNQLWLDLLAGLIHISNPKQLGLIPPELPVYVLGGERDPVSDMGKGLERLVAMLKSAGIRDVDADIYPDGRHEMFNETNRDMVIDNLLEWLGRSVSD